MPILGKSSSPLSYSVSAPLEYDITADRFSHMAITPAMTTRTVAVQQEDMNPLKPCGSCTEWLKKIAEVNPSFKVLSFTDESCTGVYVESIFEQ